MSNSPRDGSLPTFRELLDQLGAMHDAKGADYGDGIAPYSNLRRSWQLGIPPFLAALVRMSDKWERLVQLSKQPPRVKDESIADTLLDLALYALIARILHAQELAEGLGEGPVRSDPR